LQKKNLLPEILIPTSLEVFADLTWKQSTTDNFRLEACNSTTFFTWRKGKIVHSGFKSGYLSSGNTFTGKKLIELDTYPLTKFGKADTFEMTTESVL